MKKYKLLSAIIAAALLMPLLACTPGNATPTTGGFLIAGAGDLAYLSFLTNDWAADNPEVPAISMALSDDSINQLRKGNCDAVLLGREPTEEELKGLTDHVIAYDAVCMIIDENSYLGGVRGSATYPTAKTTGLQGLTSGDVKSILTTGYTWNGEYYNSKIGLDPASILWTLDGGMYAWDKAPVQMSTAFIFPPGKFDTQSVLFQKLGIDENQAMAGRTVFTSPKYKIEEEVISYEYNGSNYSQKYGVQNFAFKIGFASRRAMTLAPKNAPVRVLKIDGIDPLANPAAVVDGSYPFSRKIHFLTRDNGPVEMDNLAALLLSPAGQQFIADSGYIPVAAGQ